MFLNNNIIIIDRASVCTLIILTVADHKVSSKLVRIQIFPSCQTIGTEDN